MFIFVFLKDMNPFTYETGKTFQGLLCPRCIFNQHFLLTNMQPVTEIKCLIPQMFLYICEGRWEGFQ